MKVIWSSHRHFNEIGASGPEARTGDSPVAILTRLKDRETPYYQRPNSARPNSTPLGLSSMSKSRPANQPGPMRLFRRNGDIIRK
ncbi:hypothetical protein L596_015156 [Steinernema carpocapsae]|uniref:Uncharacterized protein n=1 Tax=Steinernema carpocapsae TaxID=34508 RepID=A0A4U5NEQ2_STECR|nr:hypothetical protein L596_015156 [Steinernema carpocapsae]